ncbi:MAG: hypothetical protein HY815_15450 [Candidatus Riflebacteria bacterium]|nr:hypothetical protein [Candidatus Riflebacteria bacterium]
MRPRKLLEAFAAILEHSSYHLALETYARLGAKCSRCATSCQLFETPGEPRDIPCNRSGLRFRIYRRYCTRAGVLSARLLGSGFVLTEEYIDEMAEAFYRCTACRRCKLTCPMGVDHGLVTHLSRWLLAEVGVVPKALVVAVREQLQGVGNTSAIPVPALKDTCEFLEEEFRDNFGVDVKFPIDVEGAEHVFFPAVSDYLLEPDTLMGNAAVMHVTRGSWTIGTGNYDGINYGLFYSDRMMERIVNNLVKEVRRLKGKKILVGECGHATRSAWFARTFCGPDAPPVVNFLQYSHAQLEAGKIPLKKTRIKERVTYHDPCNLARAGKITEQPREILAAICENYVEMVPNRTENYCCGGGGGTVSIDEIRQFRTRKMGRRKADQIRETGATFVVAPCANCKKQLKEVCEDNGLENVQVVGLHDLLLKVIDLGGGGSAPAGDDGASPVGLVPAAPGRDAASSRVTGYGGGLVRSTVEWLVPYRKLRHRVTLGVTSLLFHVAIICVPIFLAGHIELWARATGLSWPAIPNRLADVLTVLALLTAPALCLQRVLASDTRALSRFQDYALPLVVALPFLSGFLLMHPTANPLSFETTLLVHVLSASFVLVLIPITKLVHMALMPGTQLISELAWHWPPDGGSKVAAALGKEKELI